jgi:ribonuclease-3
MRERPRLPELEERLGHRFANQGLLLEAVTHASFANEAGGEGPRHYDRLEFLGDAVVGLLLAEDAYEAAPDASSGEMSRARARFAQQAALAAAGQALDLASFARLSAGELQHGGLHRQRLLADLYEAVVGAIYRDAGLEPARAFVVRTLLAGTPEIDPELGEDHKSRLQELAQSEGKAAPSYRVLAQEGPPHAPSFLVEVEIEGRVEGQGVGGSKREAEQEAARVALRAWPAG